MRRVILVLALLLSPLPGLAQGSGNSAGVDAADAAAIRSVIERQLEAFQHDDGRTAFTFASPDLQDMFGTPEAFMAMVKGGYQPVYRPREHEFRDLAAGESGPVQKVLFVAADGRVVIALYSMERESDGSWRISGCTLLATEERTSWEPSARLAGRLD